MEATKLKRGTFKSVLTIVIIAFMVMCAGCQTLAPGYERKTLSLSGQWRFGLDPNNVGENEKWYDSDG
jgi:hypothetical protein